jgi:hypothetical protein
MDTNEKLIQFHRDLMVIIPREQRYHGIIDSLDEIIGDVTGVKFRTCPFCHDMLFEGNGTRKTWTCNSIGNHGGQHLIFLEGTKDCEFVSNDGPYCMWHGFCLCQVHGPIGHPIRCKIGRIDAQSPKQ